MAVTRQSGLINGGMLGALGTVGRVGTWMRALRNALRMYDFPTQAEILTPHARIAVPRPYDLRKQSLPRAFTTQDWDRALNYWDYRCAVCERPRGLWHTLAQDHWMPLTSPDCPGTVPWNILPLCHGDDGCNNSKGKKDPQAWLTAKLGTRRGNRKLREIDAYFAWAEEHATRRHGCPSCGGVVRLEHHDFGEYWRCLSCESVWDEYAAQTYAYCPTCDCAMQPIHAADTRHAAHTLHYACPRCQHTYDVADLPEVERCPGCTQGVLRWTTDETDEGGFWRCTHCLSEWVDAEA